VSYILPTKIDFICDLINLAAFRFIQFADCHVISLVTMRKLFYTYLFIKFFFFKYLWFLCLFIYLLWADFFDFFNVPALFVQENWVLLICKWIFLNTSSGLYQLMYLSVLISDDDKSSIRKNWSKGRFSYDIDFT